MQKIFRGTLAGYARWVRENRNQYVVVESAIVCGMVTAVAYRRTKCLR